MAVPPPNKDPQIRQCAAREHTGLIEDRNCNGLLDATDRVLSGNAWISVDQFSTQLQQRGILPAGQPLLGRRIAAIEQFARFAQKASDMLPMCIASSHGDDTTDQVNCVGYYEMANAVAKAELGFSLADTFAKQLTDAIEQMVNVRLNPNLLGGLHVMLEQMLRVEGPSARYVRLQQKVADAVRQHLQELTERVIANTSQSVGDVLEHLILSAGVLNVAEKTLREPLTTQWCAAALRDFRQLRRDHAAATDTQRKAGAVAQASQILANAQQLAVELELTEEERQWLREPTASPLATPPDSASMPIRATEYLDQLDERLRSVVPETVDVFLQNAVPAQGFFAGSETRLDRVLTTAVEEVSRLGREGRIFYGERWTDTARMLETLGTHLPEKRRQTLERRFFQALQMASHVTARRKANYGGRLRFFSVLNRTAPRLFERSRVDERIAKELANELLRMVRVAHVRVRARPADPSTIADFLAYAALGHYAKTWQVFDPDSQRRIDHVLDATRTVWRTADVVKITPTEISATVDMQTLVPFAQRYWELLTSYPQFARDGTNFIYGPLLDVGRADLYHTKRIHTDNPQVALLFAELTIAKTLLAAPHTVMVVKHAPGIGSLNGNPEWEQYVMLDSRGLQQIEREFSGFANIVRRYPQHVAVMVSGAGYPAIDPQGRPAVFSPPVIAWLRERLGPDAVLVTDDLGTRTLETYISEQELAGATDGVMERTILAATRAGTDIMLYYDSSPAFVSQYVRAGEQFVASGAVAIDTLRASVRRILLMKQQLYPDHPLLQDVDRTMNALSVKELWMQKIVLPSGSVRRGQQLTTLGAGGLAFEGVPNASLIQRSLRTWAADTPTVIPPLLANNSPQEVANRSSSYNPARVAETSAMRAFDDAVRRLKRTPDPVAFRKIRDIILQVLPSHDDTQNVVDN